MAHRSGNARRLFRRPSCPPQSENNASSSENIRPNCKSTIYPGKYSICVSPKTYDDERGEQKEVDNDGYEVDSYDYIDDLDNCEDWETIRCDENATTEERVKAMDMAFNRACGALGELDEDLFPFEKVLDTVAELEKYQSSGLWKKDFEADEAESSHRMRLAEFFQKTYFITSFRTSTVIWKN